MINYVSLSHLIYTYTIKSQKKTPTSLIQFTHIVSLREGFPHMKKNIYCSKKLDAD
jgi:hypothetical protein